MNNDIILTMIKDNPLAALIILCKEREYIFLLGNGSDDKRFQIILSFEDDDFYMEYFDNLERGIERTCHWLLNETDRMHKLFNTPVCNELHNKT